MSSSARLALLGFGVQGLPCFKAPKPGWLSHANYADTLGLRKAFFSRIVFMF